MFCYFYLDSALVASVHHPSNPDVLDQLTWRILCIRAGVPKAAEEDFNKISKLSVLYSTLHKNWLNLSLKAMYSKLQSIELKTYEINIRLAKNRVDFALLTDVIRNCNFDTLKKENFTI